MIKPAPRATAALHPDAARRIRRSCAHAYVPSEPAVRGYRYIDLGGNAVPFYLLRLQAGDSVGAVSLTAPIELSSGEPAERGAPGIARARVTVGVHTVPWARLLAQDLGEGAWDDLLASALHELSRLDLLDARECPICAEAE
jgi:hypothetical protein